jgi:chromate transporter
METLPAVPPREAIRVWCRVAALSFGGPAGQIAVMQRILVDEKRWVSQERFLHALNYCMLLPGPEAQQLTIYLGWLLNGTTVGVLAGVLFVLPGFLAILAMSLLYVGFQDSLVVAGLLYGLKPAVLAIVVEALLRIGRRALGSRARQAIAVVAFVAIFVFDVPFPLIVVAAAAAGWWTSRRPGVPATSESPPVAAASPGTAATAAIDPSPSAAPPREADRAPPRPRATWRRSVVVLLVWLAIWWTPVGIAAATLGGDHVVVEEALFFSQTAMVTFGGAYAVLAYVGQRAVEDFGWLSPEEMLDGLGMAETTPGPLIMVLQFVGFLGAWRDPGVLSPLASAVLGATMTTWVTFAPSFLWILLGAPWVEELRGRRGLAGALGGITAAVVGVILNLAVWFGLHVLFGEVRELPFGPARAFVPTWGTLDPIAAAIAALSFWLLLRARVGMVPTLVAAVAAGALGRWLIVG